MTLVYVVHAGEETGAHQSSPTPAPTPTAQATKTTRPSFKRELIPAAAAAKMAAGTTAGSTHVPHVAPGELWSARVLLLGGLPHRVLHSENQRGFRHQLDLPFLVRKRSKGELQLLGGSWEPKDGGHPDKDPGALIRTAIRTVKEQSGAKYHTVHSLQLLSN